MPRLHSRRIHSEQRSFAFTVGERRLGGRRTWRRSGERQHPARISAAATGDSGPHLRSGDRRLCRQGSSSSSAPRMAGPRPPRVGPPLLLLALGMAVGGVKGGNGRRRRREVGADAAALGRCFAFLLAALELPNLDIFHQLGSIPLCRDCRSPKTQFPVSSH